MFRWKRGVLHALIPFGLAIAGGLAILVTKNPADPEKLGEGVGRFAFCAFIAGLGISYLAQTGRKKAALWASLALVAAVGALAAIIATTAPRQRLHAADRAPLVDRVIDGSHRLVHPTLGFSILRPPASYQDSPQMAAAMGVDDPDTVAYAYADMPAQSGLIVAVIANAGESRSAFEEVVAGVRRGILKSMTAQLGSAAKLEWVRNDITGDDVHLEAHLHAVLQGLHMQLDIHALHPSSIVSITVLARDATTLADVLASFRM